MIYIMGSADKKISITVFDKTAQVSKTYFGRVHAGLLRRPTHSTGNDNLTALIYL